MAPRNLNPFVVFERWAAAQRPKLAFSGRSRAQFAAWQKRALPQVLATLGQAPRVVAPEPELLSRWEEDGLIKERWVINTQPDLSAIVLVFRPVELGPGEKRPAILCCHGHGDFGKDPVMGLARDPARRKCVQEHNYDYGLQMAKAGFVTYALDWLGFGERDSLRKPHYYNGMGQRDPCNVHYLCATLLGMTVLGMNLHDAKVATDFVCRQPYVNARKLGVMGLSYGGTMTTWVMLHDRRFRAADVICYAGPFYDIAFATYNVCGSQVTPGLFDLVDTADLQGLIAPRPLLLEVGLQDECFHADHVLGKHVSQLQRVYRAAGAEEMLELDVFPGPHAWGGNKSVGFFRKHLGA